MERRISFVEVIFLSIAIEWQRTLLETLYSELEYKFPLLMLSPTHHPSTSYCSESKVLQEL